MPGPQLNHPEVLCSVPLGVGEGHRPDGNMVGDRVDNLGDETTHQKFILRLSGVRCKRLALTPRLVEN